MILAENLLEIPKYLYHNPQISDIDNNLVEDYLIVSGMEVPKFW